MCDSCHAGETGRLSTAAADGEPLNRCWTGDRYAQQSETEDSGWIYGKRA